MKREREREREREFIKKNHVCLLICVNVSIKIISMVFCGNSFISFNSVSNDLPYIIIKN